MLGFNHVLAGSIIAVITPAPLVPFVALASHFVFDMFPHFGESKTVYPYTKPFIRLLFVDAVACILGLALALWLFPTQWPIIFVGAFFGAFPDFLWVYRDRGPKWFRQFLTWANVIQWGERPYGWLFDVFYAGLFVFTLFALADKLV
ncbi:MAG: hypothetical protein JWN75_601 [Candidatus Saccharibacteria bacterium]|nr:hypothetical protein [Candidatus Saccharibacteria bacterium]